MGKPTMLPITSFDPRFRSLLLKGAKERVVIPCESKGQATKLRQRLHEYRYVAKRHFGDVDPSEWLPLYGAKVTLSGTDVVIQPRDAAFDKAISTVDLTAQQPDPAEGGSDLLDRIQSEIKSGQ